MKKNHVLCPDQTTLFQEIQNAFKDKDEPPVVLELLAQIIFDYVTLYRPVINESLAHHQEPHQFRIKRYTLKIESSSSSSETSTYVTLVHYKMWAHSKFWLPMEKENITLDNTGADFQGKISTPDKKRKMSRHQITKGQMIEQTKKRLKAAPSVSRTPRMTDIPENVVYSSDSENGVFSDSLSALNAPKGILWISLSPDLSEAPP